VAVWTSALALLWSGVAMAQGAKAAPMYVGIKGCKSCHNSEKGGAQFKKWSDSKHASAFATLATPKALEIAKAKGIADPQKADECLQCHVTGHGKAADMFKPTFAAADGVGCESCHGPGSDYKKMKTMQGVRDKTIKAADVGLVHPTRDTCKSCHNEKSPTYKPSKFEEDSTKIAHSIPAGFKRGAAAEGGE
jgi:hypothetical protein